MTMQSVKTQRTNLFGNNNTNVTKKGKLTGTGFDALISNNMRLNQSISDNKEAVTVKKASYQKADAETKKNDKVDNNSKDTDDVLKKDAVSTETTKTESKTSKPVEETKTADNPSTTKLNTEDTDAKEQQMLEVAGMLQAISDLVMQALNLTEEEFNQLLEQQGLSISDLMNSESLQQLLLASKGETDITSILTDENLANQMKELLEQVEGIISDNQLGLSRDEIGDLISQAKFEMKNEPHTDAIISDGKQTEKVLSSNQPEAVNAIQNSTSEESKTTASEGIKENAVGSILTEETKEGNSSSQQDTTEKELGAEDHFQTFIDNLVKSTGETKLDIAGNVVQVTELREIANQIIERIKVSITPDQTSMELQLNPENLGKVNLNVQSKNGVMTAQFVVQNEVTKEAIESQMHILRESLNEQGIKVEAIEVTVSNYTFQQTGQEQSQTQSDSKNNTSGKKITLEEAMAMTEEPEEVITEEINLGIGSQVDYTA